MDCAFPGFDKWRVPGLPPSAFYIPDFITPEEEELLLRKIEETPQPKWKTVGTGRRLQYWGGTLSGKNVLLPEELPVWLREFPDIVGRIDTFLDAASGVEGTLGVNQVLINQYKPGQGISPHEDGAAFRPLVATVSLRSHTVLDLYHYVSPTTPSPPMVASGDGEEGKVVAAVPLAHLLLLPRSLLILTGSLYQSHLHGIDGRLGDTVVAHETTDHEHVNLGQDQGKESGAGEDNENTKEQSSDDYPPVVVANAALLGRPDIEADIVNGGWTARRDTRTSLTFRRANKVLKGAAFGFVGAKLRRG